MSPKRALMWLVVSVLVVQIHHLFASSPWSGNLFPFDDYPQTFQWYVYTLGKKVSASIILGVFAFREKCQWLAYVVMAYWLFETKEIFDYVLMANKNAFVYDVAMCLAVFVFFLLREIRHLNLDTYDYETDYE